MADGSPGRTGNTETLHAYWGTGKGAAKIRWGTPGDHERCVRELVDDAHFTEEQAHGYCNLMEKRITGRYPAQHAQQEKTHAAGELPALVTIPGVDLVAAGTWNLTSGKQTFTTTDLRSAVDAAGCPAVGAPTIKLGHTDTRFKANSSAATGDGEPALGRVKNLRLAAEGNKVVGDLVGMPGWLGSIAASAYPQRSIEGLYNFTCQIGHTHPFVITGLALLGVTPPGVGVLEGLPDVAALYGLETHAAAGRWQTAPQAAGGPIMPVTEADVRRAYFEAAGTPLSHWITELQMDPAQLIVADEATGQVFRVPFSITAGAVAFGDAVQVAAGYTDVASSRGTGQVVVYANAAESRSVLGAGGDGDHGNIDTPNAADLDAAARRYCAAQGWAMSDGSYPVRPANLHGAADLDSAVRAVGRGGGSHDAIRAHIRKRAGAIGLSDRIPGNWGSGGALKTASGDVVEVDAAGNHPPCTSTHSHPHAAMGSQGGDVTHDHQHTHGSGGSPDANHAHAHAGAGPTGGGSDVQLSAEQMAQLRQRLGLGDDEEPTFEQIFAALGQPPAAPGGSGGDPGQGQGEGGQGEGGAGQGPGAAGGAVAASGGQSIALPPGVIAVDRTVWEDTQTRIRKGEQAFARQQQSERETVLAAAVQAGKFAVNDLDRWRITWDDNPDNTRQVIASLTPGVVPTSDVGEPGGEPVGLDPEYERLFPPNYRRQAATGFAGRGT